MTPILDASVFIAAISPSERRHRHTRRARPRNEPNQDPTVPGSPALRKPPGLGLPRLIAERRTLLSDRIKELDRKIQKTGQLVLDEVLTSSDAKAMNAPMLAERDAARAELASLPAAEGVPRFVTKHPMPRLRGQPR